MQSGAIFFYGLGITSIVLCIIGLIATFKHANGYKNATNTMLWINGTYAVVSKINNWPMYRFGWYNPNYFFRKKCKKSLEEASGIKTESELYNTVLRLREGMHNNHALEIVISNGMDIISRKEFNENMKKIDSKKTVMYYTNIYNAYEKFGENAILGWDLSCAVSLCSMGYAAGLFTYEDGLERALEIGKQIQNTFDNWDSFYDSYVAGYAFWNEDDISSKYSSYKDRLKIIYDFKKDPNSFYHVDWNLDLDDTSQQI